MWRARAHPLENHRTRRDTRGKLERLQDLFLTAADKNAPIVTRRVHGYSVPWLRSDLKKLMKERDYHLKKAFSANKELHWSNYKRLRNTIRMHKEKSDYQYGVSLNLSTGPIGHATLFNQWEGMLVFINKQIKISPKHRHSNQKFPKQRTE